MYFDDGIWIPMVRRWCDGARLYADVFESKGPLFFLALRPICWYSPSDPVLVQGELFVYWVPILAFSTFLTARLARNLALGPMSGLLLGIASGLMMFSGIATGLLATERLASAFGLATVTILTENRAAPRWWHSPALALAGTAGALVSWRCGCYCVLYLFLRNLTPRLVLLDMLLSVGLVLAVCVATLGFDAESYRFFAHTITYGFGYPRVGPLVLLEGLIDERMFGREALWPLILPYFGTRVASLSRLWHYPALFWTLGAFGAVAYSTIKRWPGALAGWLSVSFSVFWIGLPWDHTFVLFIPFLILVAGSALSRRSSIRLVLMGIWVVALLTDQLGSTSKDHFVRPLSQQGIAEIHEIHRTFRTYLSQGPWISLLHPLHSPLANPEIALPLNRMFHQYAWVMPAWSRQEILELLTRQCEGRWPCTALPPGAHVTVAYTNFLQISSPNETLSQGVDSMIELALRVCTPVARVNDPGFGYVTFLDCKPDISNASSVQSWSEKATFSVPNT